MKDVNYTQRLKARKKRALGKNLFINLLLLLPPLLCLAIIIMTALVTFSLSLFLIYFILPMFYTVDRRLRYDISGIGNPNFTYADGYKAFFTSSKGGIFGVIMAIFSAVALILLFYLIFSPTIEPLINCFPDASVVWKEANNLINQEQIDEAITLLQDNISFLIPPLTIFCGLVGFIPSLYVIFFAINNNLNNHYLATIVLPDIDKNISASQARNLSRTSFGALINLDRLKNSFLSNWLFYLIYSTIYGLLLYAFTFVKTDNVFVMEMIIFLAPTLSLFCGFFINYFCLLNDYAYLEENQNLVLERMPMNMRASIYQTYCNPHYVHGEESANRGCFVPAETYRDVHPFNSPFSTFAEQTPAPSPENDTPVTQDTTASSETTDEEPTGVVIDLSAEVKKTDTHKPNDQGKEEEQ